LAGVARYRVRPFHAAEATPTQVGVRRHLTCRVPPQEAHGAQSSVLRDEKPPEGGYGEAACFNELELNVSRRLSALGMSMAASLQGGAFPLPASGRGRLMAERPSARGEVSTATESGGEAVGRLIVVVRCIGDEAISLASLLEIASLRSQ